MVEPVLNLRGAERMHVEADVFAVLAVAIAFEGAHLVERAAQVRVAEWTVLIVLQPVLVIEMQRPKFIESHREIDFVGGIEPGQDRVRGFDQAPDALFIARELRDRQRMANRGNVGVVHQLVRLGFDGEPDVFVIGEHAVEGFDEQLDAAASTL